MPCDRNKPVSLCVPFLISATVTTLLVVKAISLFFSHEKKDKNVAIGNLIKILIVNVPVGFLLYYLCRTCRYGWAWAALVFFMLLPILVIGILMILLISSSMNNKKEVDAL